MSREPQTASNKPEKKKRPGDHLAPSVRENLPCRIQIRNTRLCIRHLQGQCYDKKCSFAHGLEELRDKPRLEKTRLCHQFASTGNCSHNANCRFAHGESELRYTMDLYKTKMCPKFQEGKVDGRGAPVTFFRSLSQREMSIRSW